MIALLYIIRKSIKNSLKELLKKPGKLVLYLLVIASIVVVAVMSLFTAGYVDNPAPLFWFTGIVFCFITFFFVVAIVKGLSGGDAIFDMNDVNLLFVSPVNSRKILLYGIIRMAKMAFAASFFILFQTSSLANFGIGYDGVLLTFAGFLLSMLVVTAASLLIYSATNGRPARKLFVKCITAALFLPLAVYTVFQYAQTRDMATALEAALKSPFLRCVPVAGWTAGGVTAFLSGELLEGMLFFGLNLFMFSGMIIYILLSNPDYYEDVLVATETAFEKKRARSEGNLNAAGISKGKVKITKTGIPGNGAAALFGKHVRESFRQSRFGFLSLTSALVSAGAIVLLQLVGELPIVLQILMWMQIFLIGTGRGLMETYSHYIYLIPESSFKKIIWGNMEIMARTLIESVLIFGVGGILAGGNPLHILLCTVTYTLFSVLLLGVNYLSMRFLGADISAGILIMIYIAAVILMMAPGLVLAFIAGAAVGGNAGFAIGLLILSGWELVVGLGCFALSKGVLHNCDMPVYKASK